ncbi:MAG: ATP-binding protein [Gammaproteobacteria bacterium]|nr:ATP-binding protein [Gammaproteobacteria bacterium]
MTETWAYLRLNCLRILQGVHIAYEENFHAGINIIRGQNGSGKSTIADFIFFILGGEFEDWKEAAGLCDEVQAEIETTHGRLTLRRKVAKHQEPILVYFGAMGEALESSTERWERFPIRRQANHESFSQLMFRSTNIPEAQSEGAANITMHQILRLCYSDQRTPAPRLFRFEQFDTRSIREAVGDLICGISDYELYDIDLKLRELEASLNETNLQIRTLHKAMPYGEKLKMPEEINIEIEELSSEASVLRDEISKVDELVEVGKVKAYLGARKNEQGKLITKQSAVAKLESSEKLLQFEIREIGDFVDFLGELKEKLSFAEATFHAIGSIEFSHCPACGEELNAYTPKSHCIVCKAPFDVEKEGARYNQIRLDLDIQTRESRQLIEQKTSERQEMLRELRRLRREYEKQLTTFNIKYSGVNSPREAFLASRINRLGYIDAEIDFQEKSLGLAAKVAELVGSKVAYETKIESLKGKAKTLRDESMNRRSNALSRVSSCAASILRADLERQEEFVGAKRVQIDFTSDSIFVDGLLNFAESSNVILKNAAILGLLLAAGSDAKFFHPRFVLIDNIEDKGMEVERSHLFQQVLVERLTELDAPYQAIYTTSMMNPDLELDNYTIGPAYESDNRSLKLRS